MIPAYNAAHCISRTLDCAVAQTHAAYEVIVVDDGSSDDTAAIVSQRHPAARLIRLPRNSGVAMARNEGVAVASGELIAFLDSDDLWSPDKLALQTDDLDEFPDAVLSFSDIIFGRTGTALVYSVTQPFEGHRVFMQLIEGGPILPSAVMVRRGDFEAVGGFAGETTPAEDRDLWLRLAARGPFRFLPLPLVRRVVYPGALSHRSELWEAAYDRVVTRFLARPEGAPYLGRARSMRAFQLFKIGVRHLLSSRTGPGLRYVGRALLRDPLVACRLAGRRLVREMAHRSQDALFGLAEPALGRVIGRRHLRGMQRTIRRLTDVALRCDVPPPPPPPRVRFRLPPDAD